MTLPEGPSPGVCAWSRQAATFFPYKKLLTDSVGQERRPDSVGAAGLPHGVWVSLGSLDGGDPVRGRFPHVSGGCGLSAGTVRAASGEACTWAPVWLACGCVPGENPGGLGGS